MDNTNQIYSLKAQIRYYEMQCSHLFDQVGSLDKKNAELKEDLAAKDKGIKLVLSWLDKRKENGAEELFGNPLPTGMENTLREIDSNKEEDK